MSYNCFKCNIKGHSMDKCPNKIRFKCRACGLYLNTEEDIELHFSYYCPVNKDKREIRFECTFCGKLCNTNENLKKHMSICLI